MPATACSPWRSTKFAVEGISEALAAEVGPLGIAVTLVEPGYFRTDFLDASSLHTEAASIDDYAGRSGASWRCRRTSTPLRPIDDAAVHTAQFSDTEIERLTTTGTRSKSSRP